MDRIIYWDINPEIFWITESFPLKYYGLFFVSGLMLSYYILKNKFEKIKIPHNYLEKLFIYTVTGTFLGARLGHCLFYDLEYYLNNPFEIFLPIKIVNNSINFIGFRGLASHGGAIGVIISIIFFCRKYKLQLLNVLDLVAIVAPLSAFFIRIGNFMNSEIYGKPTNGNWGVVFVKDDLIPRHPTQLYEALAYFSVFIIMNKIYKIKKETKGFITGLFLILLFSSRFLIEFFKENQESFEDNMLINMGQILSLPMILLGLILILNNKIGILQKFTL